MEDADDIALRVLALVRRETGMPVELSNGLFYLCDERRENVDFVLEKFRREFDVDMSAFDYAAAFPPAPPGNAWVPIALLFGTAIMAMLGGLLLWALSVSWFGNEIGSWVGYGSMLPLWIVGIGLAIRLLAWLERKSGRRDLWKNPDNAATVKTLIDSAHAKQWAYRPEKVVSP